MLESSEMQLSAAAACIKTCTEQATDATTQDAMQNAIHEGQQIIFLGFAFHPSNMTLLTPTKPGPGAQVFATAIGIGAEDQK